MSKRATRFVIYVEDHGMKFWWNGRDWAKEEKLAEKYDLEVAMEAFRDVCYRLKPRYQLHLERVVN